MVRFWPFRLPRPLTSRRERVAFLGLGSNVGDRLETIRSAIDALDHMERIAVERVSSVYETEPVLDVEDPDHSPYLNCVVCVTTTHGPRELLEAAHRVEADHGRDRGREGHHGARPLDIDLLLYDDEQIDEPGLTIPHRDLHERAFVLVPLAEILPPGATLPDGTRVTARLAGLAPITGIDLHVRLTEGPGTSDDPLTRRPPGPPGGRPHLGTRQGGPGRSDGTGRGDRQ
jgi:2-amino-4-hydroxy-6-hydroxymethyldihydropteridine diphosphokinase